MASIPEDDKFYLENISPRSRVYRALADTLIRQPLCEEKRRKV